jgi:iron complex outermembrane receptor protein
MLAHSPRIKSMSNQGPEKPGRADSQRVGTYLFCLLLLVLTTAIGFAQSQTEGSAQQGGSGAIHGTVIDPASSVVANATIAVKNLSTGKVIKAVTDQEGHFSVTALSAGKYVIEVSAPGFAVTNRTVEVAQRTEEVGLALQIGDVSQAVTVDVNTADSIAAQLAPMDSVLEARSARTEISTPFIQNYTSPISDYSELLQMAPGTFSINSNGVGLGDSKTYFRGFKDGYYDITFDGIPFEDTNTPTHHSWAFFPSEWIGSVDFDRSPGSASTIGPTPFGGSINLLSREIPTRETFRGSVSYGSFNTVLIDGGFDSGSFGGVDKKSSLIIDAHRLTSDGYQTFNFQRRNAGSVKYQYKLSDKTVLTAFSGVLQLRSNTPNAKGPTRAQVAQFGDNFLLTNDPASPLNYKFYTYRVPTDFEYVDLNSQLGHGWSIDLKPYTYRYYNEQFYNNSATSIAATSAVDKLNSYRKYGENFVATQVSRFGVFRTGLWYEWAKTNRYQIPSDPRTRVDAALPNFHERFNTTSVQPYAEFAYHATNRLILTAGLKYAYYKQDLTQYADNGKTVGNLGGQPFVQHSAAYHSYLPSLDASFRLKNNWSVYGQFATGSVIPPSSVFDVKNGAVTTLPKPTTAKTFQFGSVLKLRRLTLNVDAYYTHFQNDYSPSPDPNTATATQYTASGDSVSKGFESEANVYITRGLSVYANATVGTARFVTDGLPNKGLWVSNTPSNTEALGLTYQHKYFDVGFFNKRVGPMWNDNTAANGSTLNQVIPIQAFNVTNLFFNFTLKNSTHFDQTKFRLSFNNLFDQHNITSVTQVAKGPAYIPGPGDTLGLLPGRSVTLTVSFGYSPREQ